MTNVLTDPVCGMAVTPASDYHLVYNNSNYYFCCNGCLVKFTTDPEYYLNPAESKTGTEAADARSHICPMCPGVRQEGPGACPSCGMALEPEAVQPLATRTEYTCPMHPEIVQDEPGTCPKCGMALEPRSVTVEEKNEELIDMTRRFWLSVVLALPVFVLAMVADLAPGRLPEGLSMKTVQWIQFALATPVVLWCGWPFFVRGWQSLVTWNLNMFTLIGLGVSVAWTYSTVALLFPEIFPAIMQMENGRVDVYFEAAAVITTLVLLGQVLELRARARTSGAIRALLQLAPKIAHRLDAAGSESDIALEDVQQRSHSAFTAAELLT